MCTKTHICPHILRAEIHELGLFDLWENTTYFQILGDADHRRARPGFRMVDFCFRSNLPRKQIGSNWHLFNREAEKIKEDLEFLAKCRKWNKRRQKSRDA